jgi:hypothetical protein
MIKSVIPENRTMKTPHIYYGIIAVFCVIAIGVGIANAMDLTQSPDHIPHGKGQAHPGFDLTNTNLQQQMISRFEQQGTDVSGLKAAFESGDMTAVKTWLEANRPTHPGWQHHHVQEEKTAAS